MKIRVSDELDVVRILFHDAPIEESEPLGDNFIMDYDENGKLVGMEVMSARQVFGEEQVERMKRGLSTTAAGATRQSKGSVSRKQKQDNDLIAA